MRTSGQLIICQWCNTTNDSSRLRCVLCDVKIGIPVLDGLPDKETDAAMRSAYTRDGRLPWRNRPIEHSCIKTALAEQFPLLEMTLIIDETDSSSPPYLGWRWPSNPIISAVDLRFIRGARLEGNFSRGGSKVGFRREKRIPRRRGVNLRLPSADEMRGITVQVLLCTEIEGSLVRTHPRVVHSSKKLSK
jgi:hypothetical protein